MRVCVSVTETELWKTSAGTKPTLGLYCTYKRDIVQEHFIDNSLGSALTEACMGVLRMKKWQARIDGKCRQEEETIEHIVVTG